MALFHIENLNKTYFGPPDTQVLYDINFSIEKGEFVSIMGSSGSGKSTLLHILGFLLGPTDGTYTFNGKEFRDHNEEEIAHVRNEQMGFVFQTFNLLPRMSVYDNVALPLMYSDRPEHEWSERIQEVIDLVGLSHRSGYATVKLSGGERQRTAIARALVNRPSVIFADEPTGNLDSESGRIIMDTLAKLHTDMGHTIVLVTHEQETAEYAERMIYIQDGRIGSDTLIKKE